MKRCLLIFLIIGIASTSCTQKTALIVTSTPLLSEPPVPIPTSTLLSLPTDTPIPISPPTITSTGTSTPTRVRFSPGATAATLADLKIAAQGVAEYVLQIEQGQWMMVEIETQPSKETPAFALVVYNDEGTIPAEYPNLAEKGFWKGVLPATGDYILQVVNRGASTGYSLYVHIPPRIAFAPGTTSTAIEGRIPGRAGEQYVLHARKDQTMAVTVTSPGNDVFLGLVGSDGTPLLRTDLKETEWAGVVYATQDYFIDVTSEHDASYALRVSITNALSDAPAPIRIYINRATGYDTYSNPASDGYRCGRAINCGTHTHFGFANIWLFALP